MEIFRLPQLEVKEIMTKKVIRAGKDDTIEELVKKFKKYDFHSFPVLYDEKVVGIVTKTDLLGCIDNKKLANIAVAHVEDIMTPHPVTIAPDTPLQEAADHMSKNHVRILPVVEGERLVGLLSYSDLVKTVFKD